MHEATEPGCLEELNSSGQAVAQEVGDLVQ